MYRIQTLQDKFDIIEAVHDSGASWVRICPARGGIVTSLGIQNEELLYLDKETFYDVTANIRGGIPVLFPICGALENGEYQVDGVTYRMKNHGVARRQAWEVVRTSVAEDVCSIVMRLASNSETEVEYPFAFELEFEYILQPTGLSIVQHYKNQSSKEMPMFAGFHPYFRAEEKNIRFDTDAPKYLDYNDNQMKPYEGYLDMDSLVESVALLGAKENHISFQPAGFKQPIALIYSDDFSVMQIWSVRGKEFVCVEPWMGLTGAMNHGNGLRRIPPHGTVRAEIQIDYGVSKV